MNDIVYKKELNAYQLKWIAIITMTIDHFGKTIASSWMFPLAGFFHLHPYYMYVAHELLFGIGNVTIYIFMWFIAEGCRYTKDIRKYILRIAIFALLSEIPFQFMINIISQEPLSLQLGFTNVMFTFVLGTLGCYGYQLIKDKGYKYLCYMFPVVFAFLAYLLHTDYDFFGVITIFVLYIIQDTKKRLQALTILILLFRGLYFPILDIFTNGFALETVPIYLFLLAFSLISIPLLTRYHGKRGTSSTLHKYLFFAYYPIHIAVLVLLYKLLYS